MPEFINAKFLSSAERAHQRTMPPMPEIAFCGRSNVGKSSLINALCGNSKLARVSKTPGRTRLINTFLLPDGFYLVDLPGYGYARASREIQAKWQEFLPDYLENSKTLTVALVLVDFRIPPQAMDIEICTYLRNQGITYGVVAAKCDGVPRGQWHKRIMDIAFACKLTFSDMVFPVSAHKGTGLRELANAMRQAAREAKDAKPKVDEEEIDGEDFDASDVGEE